MLPVWHINVLRKTLENTLAVEGFQTIHTFFRAELRNFRDEVREQVNEWLRRTDVELEVATPTLYIDRASGAWNRARMEACFDELLHRGEAFVTILLWVSNLKRLEAGCSTEVIDEALKAMVQRVAAIAGPEATVGRWTHDQFVLLMNVNPAAAAATATGLAQKLPTLYAVPRGDLPHDLEFLVATAVLDHRANDDPRRFQDKLEQMTAG